MPAVGSRLNWVLGLYGLTEKVDRFAHVPIIFGPTAPIIREARARKTRKAA